MRDEEVFVEEALAAVDSGSAGDWQTVAGHLADEVRRLRELADLRMNRAVDAAADAFHFAHRAPDCGCEACFRHGA